MHDGAAADGGIQPGMIDEWLGRLEILQRSFVYTRRHLEKKTCT